MSNRKRRRDSQPIGFWTLVALVIANMIGSGLYVSSHWSIMSLGNAKLVLLVWALGGIMAICGAVAYGALSKRLPLSGGEYLFLSRLVHPSIGFLAGWISLVAGFTAPIAASAMIVGTFAVPEAWKHTLAPQWIASFTLLLGAISHSIHLQVGAWIQNLIVLMKLFCLVLFLLFAGLLGPEQGWQSGVLEQSPLTDSSWTTLLLAIFGSMAWITLSYTGFNAGVYLAGEVRGDNTLVARSMLVATLIVTVLYLLLNAVFLYGIPAEQVRDNETFVADVARAIGGGSLEGLMRFAIVLSSATSVLAMLMAGPRVYSQMARDGVMPKLFASKRVPRRAIFVQAALSLIFVWAATLQAIVGYLGLTLAACGAIAIASIWWLPKKIPDAAPIRIYEHICAAIFLLFTIVILAVAYRDPRLFPQLIACGVTFAIGIVVYLATALRSKPITESTR